jgi:hypothetical protein
MASASNTGLNPLVWSGLTVLEPVGIGLVSDIGDYAHHHQPSIAVQVGEANSIVL